MSWWKAVVAFYGERLQWHAYVDQVKLAGTMKISKRTPTNELRIRFAFLPGKRQERVATGLGSGVSQIGYKPQIPKLPGNLLGLGDYVIIAA